MRRGIELAECEYRREAVSSNREKQLDWKMQSWTAGNAGDELGAADCEGLAAFAATIRKLGCLYQLSPS